MKVVGANLADGMLTIDLARGAGGDAATPIEVAGAGAGNVLRGPQPQRQVEGQAQVA